MSLADDIELEEKTVEFPVNWELSFRESVKKLKKRLKPLINDEKWRIHSIVIYVAEENPKGSKFEVLLMRAK